MTYNFILQEDRPSDGDKLQFSVSYRGAKMKDFILKALKSHREEILKFMHYFGWLSLSVIEQETGRTVALGEYSYNVFSGRGEVEFKLK